MKGLVGVLVLLVSLNSRAERVQLDLNPTDSTGNILYLIDDFGLPANGCVNTSRTVTFEKVKARFKEDMQTVQFNMPGGRFAAVANHPDGPYTYNETQAAFAKLNPTGREFRMALSCNYNFCVRDSTWYIPQTQTKCRLLLDF